MPQPSLSASSSVRGSDASPLLITTKEAARICQVHASTVKRWCDAAQLACQLTVGGHRRIILGDLVDFARGEGIVTSLRDFGSELDKVWRASTLAANGQFDAIVDCWFRWLMAEQAVLLGPSLALLLDRGLDLALVLDQGIGRLMQGVGAAWEEGRIRIGDEHRASEHVMDALHSLRAGLAGRRVFSAGPRRAIVGSAEGDPHHLGAFMVRLILEERGLAVSYLGANVPGEEFAMQQKRGAADLVCASFSASRVPDDAVRLVRGLAQAYEPEQPYHLLLGGAALVDRTIAFPYRPFRSFAILGSLVDLTTLLDAWPEDRATAPWLDVETAQAPPLATTRHDASGNHT